MADPDTARSIAQGTQHPTGLNLLYILIILI